MEIFDIFFLKKQDRHLEHMPLFLEQKLMIKQMLQVEWLLCLLIIQQMLQLLNSATLLSKETTILNTVLLIELLWLT
jgi:hypothetical protein